MAEYRVYLIQEIIPSYRVPVFRRLSDLEDVGLTVFYSRGTRAMKRENLKSSSDISGFRHVRTGLLDFGHYIFQLGVLLRVLGGRPDVVIAGQAGRLDRLLLLALCKMLGIRFLWFQGGVPYTEEWQIKRHDQRGFLNRWLKHYNPKPALTLKADGVIAYSRHAKQYYMEHGFRADSVWVAPNSPDTAALYKYKKEWLGHSEILSAERNRFAPSGEKVLFILGRLNKVRKLDVLLQALSKLQDTGHAVSLIVIGDGGERQNLERFAKDLNLENIYFEGAIYDERELAKYFLVCDIFVTPGVSSIAIKMAMLFGVPVVTANYGLEVHDVQEGVNGCIFPMDDVNALTEKLGALLKSNELMTRLGQGGANTIRYEINIDRMIQGFHAAIVGEPSQEDSTELEGENNG